MIDKNSAIFSIPLAKLAAKKGLIISPVSGTPVAELVKISNDFINAGAWAFVNDESDDDAIAGHASRLTAVTMSNDDTENSHDDALNAFVNDIAKAAANHISFAKNVVKPVIVQLVEEIQKSLSQEINPSAQFRIEIVDLPKPMQNSGFESSINKYAEKTFIKPDSSLALGEIAPQGILELMLTGSKDYDEGIKEWFVNKGDLFFMNIWDNLFRSFKESNPATILTFEGVLLSSSRDVVDYALAIHLISRKLYDEVPENTSLSLPRYREIVAQYREASGIKLNAEYKRYDFVLKNKTLVAEIGFDGKTIAVNGPIYRDWIKNGGCNEALLGMLVGRKTVYNQSLFDEEKEKFISDWTSFSLFTKTAEKNNNFNRLKDSLTLAFAKVMESVSSTEQETVATLPGYSQAVVTRFKEEMESIRPADVNDIFGICTRLVCRVRFYYTDAEKILNGINEAVKANPGVDIREAALLSSIEYVVDYVADQLKLTS